MKLSLVLILAFCGLFCSTKPLHSEIELITLKWKPGFCSPSCLAGVEKKFKAVPDIAEILFQGDTTLLIRWKPDHKMSYPAIRNAMAAIGVGINEWQIAVRGTIKHSGKTIKLISIGDNSEFTLLGPVEITPNQAAILQNPQTLKLPEDKRQELLQAEAEFKVVTVRGPLFEPERAPPFYIIVESLQIPPSLNHETPAAKESQRGPTLQSVPR